LVCGYDKHFDVCHKKEISSFDENALIAKINDLGNLIPLCKNHHWEFDRRMLEEVDLTKVDGFCPRSSVDLEQRTSCKTGP